MRRYDQQTEDNIRTQGLVREWTRSGLLDPAQGQRIESSAQIDLRRTNGFLRLIFFVFGILIVGAAIALIANLLGLRDDSAIGMISAVGALACVGLAEYLSGPVRLYRFGIEEAAATCAVILAAFGVAFLATSSGEGRAVLGLGAGAVGAFVVYQRYGYIYAAIGSITCLALIPFQFNVSPAAERLLAVSLTFLVFLIARLRAHDRAGETRGDECETIQAAAWAGCYVLLNLHLFSFPGLSALPRTFYWFTYVAIWFLPAIGLYLSLGHKERPLIDVSLAMALATLVTNKPYLGADRHTWDPIVFGIVLAGAAIFIRRWLSTGPEGYRRGFTSSRLLNSDKRKLAVIGTISAAMHPAAAPSHPAERFEGGGGRSGGAGASGTF